MYFYGFWGMKIGDQEHGIVFFGWLALQVTLQLNMVHGNGKTIMLFDTGSLGWESNLTTSVGTKSCFCLGGRSQIISTSRIYDMIFINYQEGQQNNPKSYLFQHFWFWAENFWSGMKFFVYNLELDLVFCSFYIVLRSQTWDVLWLL